MSASPNILLRVGKNAEIEELYGKKQISFSCAANWIDYAIKAQNYNVGDVLEGVFGRAIFPFDGNSLTNRYGEKYGENLLVTPYGDQSHCYLRYMPTILMPVICFYGIDVENAIKLNKSSILFNFEGYANAMKYSNSEASIWVIKNMAAFEDDLRKGIILAVTNNLQNNITTAGFVNKFDVSKPYICGFVNYNKYDYDKDFIDNTGNLSPLLCKSKSYAYQSEFRFILNNVRFLQKLSIDNYDYSLNKLNVSLPNIESYSNIYNLEQYSGIMLSYFDSAKFAIVPYWR